MVFCTTPKTLAFSRFDLTQSRDDENRGERPGWLSFAFENRTGEKRQRHQKRTVVPAGKGREGVLLINLEGDLLWVRAVGQGNGELTLCSASARP